MSIVNVHCLKKYECMCNIVGHSENFINLEIGTKTQTTIFP